MDDLLSIDLIMERNVVKTQEIPGGVYGIGKMMKKKKDANAR